MDTQAGSTLAQGQLASSGAGWAVLAALALFLILMQNGVPRRTGIRRMIPAENGGEKVGHGSIGMILLRAA